MAVNVNERVKVQEHVHVKVNVDLGDCRRLAGKPSGASAFGRAGSRRS